MVTRRLKKRCWRWTTIGLIGRSPPGHDAFDAGVASSAPTATTTTKTDGFPMLTSTRQFWIRSGLQRARFRRRTLLCAAAWSIAKRLREPTELRPFWSGTGWSWWNAGCGVLRKTLGRAGSPSSSSNKCEPMPRKNGRSDGRACEFERADVDVGAVRWGMHKQGPHASAGILLSSTALRWD